MKITIVTSMRLLGESLAASLANRGDAPTKTKSSRAMARAFKRGELLV